jgi:hypothetical protein
MTKIHLSSRRRHTRPLPSSPSHASDSTTPRPPLIRPPQEAIIQEHRRLPSSVQDTRHAVIEVILFLFSVSYGGWTLGYRYRYRDCSFSVHLLIS